MKKNIAIIGASEGQKGLYLAAKTMGIHTLGFSWEQGAAYKDLADEFFPISITEVDEIVRICRYYDVKGVVSNGSDFTARYANEIAFKLGLPCNNPVDMQKASDKYYVRKKTKNIENLGQINHSIYNKEFTPNFPCIIKPISSGGKNGLSIATDAESFERAVEYAQKACNCEILVEDFIDGLELSVETLSANGKHFVIQTCEADTSGEPHFVEIAHHLPASISKDADMKIRKIVPEILDAINFQNGATDIEMKIDLKGNIYLIEVNLRGAGGNITNYLVNLSTGYDYLRGLIEVSMGEFKPPKILRNNYVGDYYLCSQTLSLLPLFKKANDQSWLVYSTIQPHHFKNIKEVRTNGDREGYIIYKSTHRISMSDL